MIRIGYHVSITQGIDLAFDRAKELGCTSMQVFLSNPRGWAVRKLTDEEIMRFREKHKRFDITPVFAHMTYLPNIASPNKFAYRKSIAALEFSLQRCELLGIKYLVTHLGSHLGKGKKVGFSNAVEAISRAWDASKGVMLLLENEAGQRNSIGSKIEDVAELFSRIRDEVDGVRVGLCLDTCHLFEAGYDIREESVIDGVFDKLKPADVHVIHLNDARYELGRALDRHANIGEGFICKKGFETFLNHNAVRGKPMIMETPDRGPRSDRQQIALVKSLIKG